MCIEDLRTIFRTCPRKCTHTHLLCSFPKLVTQVTRDKDNTITGWKKLPASLNHCLHDNHLSGKPIRILSD